MIFCPLFEIKIRFSLKKVYTTFNFEESNTSLDRASDCTNLHSMPTLPRFHVKCKMKNRKT